MGNYANAAQQWLRAEQPQRVQGHDFPGPEGPRAFPYGIYDLGRNESFVNVGPDHDTGAFAVAPIHGWWRFEGRHLYPAADRLLITADGGGSNADVPDGKPDLGAYEFGSAPWEAGSSLKPAK